MLLDLQGKLSAKGLGKNGVRAALNPADRSVNPLSYSVRQSKGGIKPPNDLVPRCRRGSGSGTLAKTA